MTCHIAQSVTVLFLTSILLSACQAAPPTDTPDTPETPHSADAPALVTAATYKKIREQYNARTQPIDQLYGVVNVTIEVTNQKGKQEKHRGDGQLYFRKPHDLALNIGKDLVKDTFLWIGSNEHQFWLFDMAPPKGEPKIAYLGDVGTTHSSTLPQLRLPITADRLIDVLAVSDLPEKPPVLISRLKDKDGKAAFNLLFEMGTTESGKKLTQEFFLDPESLEPRSIEFAENDVVVLRATLSRYEPMKLINTLFTRYPPIATRIDLEVPQQQATVRIDIVKPSDGKQFNKIRDQFFDFEKLKGYLKPDETQPLTPPVRPPLAPVTLSPLAPSR